MKNRVFIVSLLACWTLQSLACHPEKQDFEGDENEDLRRRKKRQIESFSGLGLEDYFVLCMQTFGQFRLLDIRTIVSFTIDQTSWFERSDLDFCSRDTVNCWQNILYRYMNRNSELFAPAIICMRRYGDYRGRESDKMVPLQNAAFIRRRSKRHASLPINKNQAAYQLRQSLSGYRGDFASLIQFFQNDAICSPGICDCTGVVSPPGEVCGENWYTKIGAMTRTSSPLRAPLVFTLNSIVSIAVRQQEIDRRQRQQQRLLQAILFSYALKNLAATTTPEVVTTPTSSSIITTTNSTSSVMTPSP